MTIDKLSLLRVFSLTGKFGQRVYNKSLILKLEEIEANFLKPTVRFRTNIWELYNCLIRASTVTLEEDLTLFRYEYLALSTKSSELALELTEVLLRGDRKLNKEDYFKTHDRNKPTPIIDWFSNIESVNDFCDLGVVLLRHWCHLNPRESDGISLSGEDELLVMNKTLVDFLGSGEFKSLVYDLINLAKFKLEKNIGLFDD